MTRNASTLLGFSAILLWSLLALFTAKSGNAPPFQLVAMSFALGSSIGLVSWIFRPRAIRALKQPVSVWVLSAGYAQLTWAIGLACLLITSGALIAAKETIAAYYCRK